VHILKSLSYLPDRYVCCTLFVGLSEYGQGVKRAIRAELEDDMLLLNIPVQRVYNLMNPVGLHDAGSAS
jgi:hypothetical protein